MSYVVGLTGGIGSGKSTIAYLFAALGVPIVDADIVAREVVTVGSPALRIIAEHFGNEILLPNGALNRALLRQKIFENPLEKDWLNKLLHPIIRQECLTQLVAAKSPYVLFVVPLLIENELNTLCQSILVVDVSEEIQLKRTCQRDCQSEQLIKKIIASQISRKERLKWATEVIENNADLNESFPYLAKEVLNLHHLYLSKSND